MEDFTFNWWYTLLFVQRKVHYPIPEQITFIQAAQFRQAMAQQRQPSKRQFHTIEIQQRHFDQVK